MLARIRSACLLGVDGCAVDVEVHVANGLPSFTVVGLPDAAVRESRDRVRAALLSSGLRWPQRRVTVNLAPSGIRKGGPGLDLAVAVGLLAAQGDVPAGAVADLAFLGELGLDGSVRPVTGLLPMVGAVARPGVVVPAASWDEARLVVGEAALPVSTLAGLVEVLRGLARWPRPPAPVVRPAEPGVGLADLADVRGQPLGRRAVEVAAAGGHHLLLIGPPGCGKTMLATRLPALLPPLDDATRLAVARIRSAAGLATGEPGQPLPTRPPLRAPHHGVTAVGMVGGGPWLRPGEASLAHGGVLFLDELGEFPAVVLDMLREPLEDGVVRVVRARGHAELPARFQLVAAMNPCPCGEGVVRGACRCTDARRARYGRRLSGPLLDRFDLAVVLGRPDPDDLAPLATATPVPEAGDMPPPSSAEVAGRVATVRALAAERGVVANAAIEVADLDRLAPLSASAAAVLQGRLRAGALSARGLHRVRRVARTVADLAGLAAIDEEHVAEALALHAGRDLLRSEGDR